LAHTFAWVRQRERMPEEAQGDFDTGFQRVLRRALSQIDG